MALSASPASPAISDQTKAEGEQVVREVFPQATIVRPSLAYGEDDHFFSRFAAMIRSSPVLPLIGGGATKFQPVFVGDVTAGLLDLLKRPDTVGKTYEFGGPQVYSFRALLQPATLADCIEPAARPNSDPICLGRNASTVTGAVAQSTIDP
jgi:uncharacterized protein YbjT (DUF2867 family)